MTSKLEALTIFAKHSVLDFCQGTKSLKVATKNSEKSQRDGVFIFIEMNTRSLKIIF